MRASFHSRCVKCVFKVLSSQKNAKKLIKKIGILPKGDNEEVQKPGNGSSAALKLESEGSLQNTKKIKIQLKVTAKAFLGFEILQVE